MRRNTLTAFALTGALLVLPLAAPSPALAGQDPPRDVNGRSVCEGGERNESTIEISIKTSKGQRVWIPSSRSAGPFQFGGTQSFSVADGKQRAKTEGTAKTVGGSGGVKIGIVDASASYNSQRNKSTTKTISVTQTFSTSSPSMPRRAHWRWRAYTAGYKFVVTKRCHIPAPIVTAGTWTVKRVVVVPSRKVEFTYAVEKYSRKGWLLNRKGKPIRRY